MSAKADRAWAEAMGIPLEQFRARFKPWAQRSRVDGPPPRAAGERRILSKPTKAKRAQVIARDGHVCRYCLKEVVETAGDEVARGDTLTIDHVVPLSRGGTNDLENLVVACWDCNQKKAWLLAEEWQPPLPAGFVVLPDALPTAACPDCTDGEWETDGRLCPTCDGDGEVSVGRALWLLLEARKKRRSAELDLNRVRGERNALRDIVEDRYGRGAARRDLADVVASQAATIRQMADAILRYKVELAEARGDDLERSIPRPADRDRALELIRAQREERAS